MKPKTPINSFGKCLQRLFSSPEREPEGSLVLKNYGSAQDTHSEVNYFEVNAKMRSTLGSTSRGTSEKIADVVHDQIRKPQKSKKPFPNDFSSLAYHDLMNKWKKRPFDPQSINPYSDIFQDFPKVQITVYNNSLLEKEVTLWGASATALFSPPLATDVQDQVIVAQIGASTGTHPQGIVYNPVNQLMYVANQLSGTVTVIGASNEIVKVIQLDPSFPGFSSPVALTVNTNSLSAKNGFVYVASSVANVISAIDLSLNVQAVVSVGVRPVAVCFNPVNNNIYVANLVSDSLTVLDAETLLEVSGSPLLTGIGPIAVGVNPDNGEVYAANSVGNSISVYNSSNIFLTTIAGVGNRPVSVTYNPANQSMYVVATNSNQVVQINPITHLIAAIVPVGTQPYNSFFDNANNYLYVQNRQSQSMTVIQLDNQVVATLNVGSQSTGSAYNPANNSIYISDTSNNRINVIGFNTLNSSISINAEYAELRADFQSNPAIIQHAKFVVTGPERINSFRLEKFTPTGSRKSQAISFEQFASPQSTLNVAEATALAGTVIDGKMNWRFKLPAQHTVSILLWFRQFQTKDLLYYPSTKETPTLK